MNCIGASALGFQRGGDMSIPEEQQSTLDSTAALDDFRIHCPNCLHQFSLSEGLLMEDNCEQAQQPQLQAEAASVSMGVGSTEQDGSLESLATDREIAPGNFGKETQLLRVAAAGGGSSRIPTSASCHSASPSALAERSGGGSGGGGSADDTESSQPVSRCYQILNWTVEELEKVICDPNDRRIRKISSISQCDIEVRSEMASSKFGAPKNYCILRASQGVNIDQCRSLLRRQLLWVMKPRAQETEGSPGC